MKIDVFVSYHTGTASDVADAVVAQLEQQGLRCWYASRDAEGRFAGNIKRAIDRSSIFVVLMNRAASESRHVKNEIALAFDNEGVEIIPLRITNEEISDDVDYYLHGFNYIDAVGDRRATGMKELISRILKKLGTPAPGTETIHYNDGRVYTGELAGGKRHGKGKLVWPDGDTYEGDWKDDRRTGRGIYIWADGARYEGDFVDGKLHGTGTYCYPGGSIYQGDWKDDQKTGRGTFTWTDGSRYEGDWKDDKRTGKGTYRWPDGTRYAGDFVNDRRTGCGTLTHADGKAESGRFQDGKYLGK